MDEISKTNEESKPSLSTIRLAPVVLGQFEINEDGLEIKGTPTFDQWSELGHVFSVFSKGGGFAVGDWLIYGEQHYGEQASQYIDHRYFSEETLRVYRWVAENIPRERRFATLSFQHHMKVAKLAPSKQQYWLGRSAANGWSAAELASEMRDADDHGAKSLWLIVRCADRKDLEELKTELEAKGRTCKAKEQIDRALGTPKKRVTAQAKSAKRSRRRR